MDKQLHAVLNQAAELIEKQELAEKTGSSLHRHSAREALKQMKITIALYRTQSFDVMNPKGKKQASLFSNNYKWLSK